MRVGLLSYVFALFFALAVIADAPEPPTTLEIQTTYKPETCSVLAQAGDALSVHYTGKLFSNGKKFDSSLDRNKPFTVTLGKGQVIKGWEEGLKGMCVEEKRTLTIPSDMGYGARGFGSVIPANSALVFDVELLSLDTKNRREEL
ncbi:uncharacterized protein FIBRA_00677 [Fibroporia radiculosa]|uniref:peptidylprolyl isomerase n=1 Tax=Fibroporia radiculosa TaxID=599839 RepID=J4GIC0_9APHY|nr:uncharacterized protein FIBRA_00677 [Fibroporia radiculosa]CCL98675.1 predicted protein [Fibroporia radiculosa]